jgi:hypothetical protein
MVQTTTPYVFSVCARRLFTTFFPSRGADDSIAASLNRASPSNFDDVVVSSTHELV